LLLRVCWVAPLRDGTDPRSGAARLRGYRHRHFASLHACAGLCEGWATRTVRPVSGGLLGSSPAARVRGDTRAGPHEVGTPSGTGRSRKPQIADPEAAIQALLPRELHDRVVDGPAVAADDPHRDELAP